MLSRIARTARIVLARKPWRWRSAWLRARADRLRRAGRPEEAEAFYRAYLLLRPDHGMAWTMLGHVLAAQGRGEEAAEAFATATERSPTDPYILHCRGSHLLRLGRLAEAREWLARAVAAGAGAAAERELAALPEPDPDDATPSGARIFIDVSDLLIYAAHNRNLSGIQRVQAELMAEALRRPELAHCVLTDPWNPEPRALSRRLQERLLALLGSGQGGSAETVALLDALRRSARPVAPVAGGWLLQAGAFWIGGGNAPLLATLKRAGMGIAVLIHDLIPITHPEVCVPDLVREFSAVLGEALFAADVILANSRHTAQTVRDFMARHGLAPRPVLPVPLAHALRPEGLATPRWSERIAPLRGQRFVLCVGTIESRKNQAFLVRLWQRLLEEGLEPPPLAIVGKLGWQTSAFERAMAETNSVGGRVRVFSSLSDGELEALYDACLFTVFPSFTEGWGLPVGESLAHGRICVASARGALPEVGGEFCFYIDPEDVEAALPLFRRLLAEPGFLAEAEARLREGFRPRHWPEVARRMLDSLAGLPPVAGGEPLRPPLPAAGGAYAPSPWTGPDRVETGLDLFRHPLRLALAEGWSGPGPRGSHLIGRQGWVHAEAPVPGRLRLALRAGPALVVSAGGQRLALAAEGYGLLELPLRAGPVSFAVSAEPVGQDGPAAPPPDARPGLWLIALEFQPDA
ncbi:MAG: glycosyltransferase family 4 protein [Rhodovarius sp.]|nr:glycosyltransferase family 4 protein [Rhodovarius sp.]